LLLQSNVANIQSGHFTDAQPAKEQGYTRSITHPDQRIFVDETNRFEPPPRGRRGELAAPAGSQRAQRAKQGPDSRGHEALEPPRVRRKRDPGRTVARTV
jgi:hypothetical protein